MKLLKMPNSCVVFGFRSHSVRGGGREYPINYPAYILIIPVVCVPIIPLASEDVILPLRGRGEGFS